MVARLALAQGTPSVATQALGHKRPDTSLKYTKRNVTLEPTDAVRNAQQLGYLPSAPQAMPNAA